MRACIVGKLEILWLVLGLLLNLCYRAVFFSDLSGNSFKNSFSKMDEILVYDHKVGWVVFNRRRVA